MTETPVCPEDSRHNHEDRFIPGQPGVIPAPPPPIEGAGTAAPGVPTRGRGKTTTTTTEATDEVASPVEEDD